MGAMSRKIVRESGGRIWLNDSLLSQKITGSAFVPSTKGRRGFQLKSNRNKQFQHKGSKGQRFKEENSSFNSPLNLCPFDPLCWKLLPKFGAVIRIVAQPTVRLLSPGAPGDSRPAARPQAAAVW